MKKKKPELDDMDVLFDPKPLTEEERQLISEYIKQDKAKRKRRHYRQQSKKNIGRTRVSAS